MSVRAVRDTVRKGRAITGESVKQNPYEAVAQISNAVTRPGPLTTEWWSVIMAGAVSSVLAAIGLPGSSAAQVAGIVAPVVLALVYAFVRTQHKGALADALQAVFPQANEAAQASSVSPGQNGQQPTTPESAAVAAPEPLALGAGRGSPIAPAEAPTPAQAVPAGH